MHNIPPRIKEPVSADLPVACWLTAGLMYFGTQIFTGTMIEYCKFIALASVAFGLISFFSKLMKMLG